MSGLSSFFFKSEEEVKGLPVPEKQVPMQPQVAKPYIPYTPQTTAVEEKINTDVNFEEVIWNGTIDPESPLGKFFKTNDTLKTSLPDEKIRLTTTLSVLEANTGISKIQVLAALDAAVSELVHDKEVVYAPQLQALKSTLVGQSETRLAEVTESIQKDELLIKDAEERIKAAKIDKINLESDVEQGMKTVRAKELEFEEKFNKILSQLNSVKVKLG